MLANKTYWENQGARRSYSRRLRFECLEDRTLLTTYTVMHLSDSSFPFGPPEQPEHTLRSAIIAANIHANSGTPDVIQFASGLSGSVNIVNGPMVIGDHVQILGPAGAVTLNAGTTDQNVRDSILYHFQQYELVIGKWVAIHRFRCWNQSCLRTFVAQHHDFRQRFCFKRHWCRNYDGDQCVVVER